MKKEDAKPATKGNNQMTPNQAPQGTVLTDELADDLRKALEIIGGELQTSGQKTLRHIETAPTHPDGGGIAIASGNKNRIKLLDAICTVCNTAHSLLSAQPASAPLRDEDAKDVERLDFVLDNSAFIIATISRNADCDVTTYQLYTQDEDENYITLSGDEKYFKSKREAIDAAIQAQGAKQK